MRMSIRNPLPAIVGFVLLLLLSSQALACRCAGKMPLKQAYHRAATVVVGKVIDLQGDPYGLSGATAVIAVRRAWKSGVMSEIRVHTSTTCAFDFKADGEYLLFLTQDGGHDRYTVRKCTGGRPLQRADAAIRWLERHAREATIDRCRRAEGRANEATPDSMPDSMVAPHSAVTHKPCTDI